MTDNTLARRRELRQEQFKRDKLNELTNIMDANGITVQDIQNHLERIKEETSTFDQIYNRRQRRRANQQRRKALRLAQEKRKNANKKTSSSKTSSKGKNGQNSQQTNG